MVILLVSTSTLKSTYILHRVKHSEGEMIMEITQTKQDISWQLASDVSKCHIPNNIHICKRTHDGCRKRLKHSLLAA